MSRAIPVILAAVLLAGGAAAQTWRPIGPAGGDVRSLASDPRDPQRLYLGTTDGHIFGSIDGGQNWQVLGRAGHANDGVVTAIIVDPRDAQRLYAALWTLHSQSGGMFVSRDAGATWQPAGLDGQSVRALAQSATDPDTLIAGTLDGVYRSRDSAATWQRISPAGHEELRNFDSIAIDPRDPRIIYAGTYHLPWKTTDGGRTWSPIHAGMLDDSDVMSIWIDRSNPQRIYASACSGIYRSDNAGRLWSRIQGIPNSAKRTHVIQQHPSNPSVVFAGTTEGLWTSSNAGATWQRVTPRDWVINALAFVGDQQLIVGTEQLGVLRAVLASASPRTLAFQPANHGFNHRRITGFAIDPQHPARVLAVLANSGEAAVATEDSGATWSPVGAGLHKHKLLQVYATPAGWWAALANGGLMRYDSVKCAWQAAGFRSPVLSASPGKRSGLAAPLPLRSRVADLAFARNAWYAATSDGLLASHDSGETWTRVPLGPLSVNLPVRSVRVSPDGQRLWLVSLRGLVFSRDAGATWSWHDLPAAAGGALRLEVAPCSASASDCTSDTLLATAAVGLYVSRDAGQSWQLAASGLPQAPLQALAVSDDSLLAAMQSGGLYVSRDAARTWTRIEGHLADGFFPAVLRGESSLIFAASASDGIFAVDLRDAGSAPRVGGNGDHK